MKRHALAAFCTDLKEQADEIPLPPDLNPKAPDIEDSVQ